MSKSWHEMQVERDKRKHIVDLAIERFMAYSTDSSGLEHPVSYFSHHTFPEDSLAIMRNTANLRMAELLGDIPEDLVTWPQITVLIDNVYAMWRDRFHIKIKPFNCPDPWLQALSVPHMKGVTIQGGWVSVRKPTDLEILSLRLEKENP